MHRHPCHHSHNLSHLLLVDSLAHRCKLLLPLGISGIKLSFELLLPVAVGRRFLEILGLCGSQLLSCRLIDLLLKLLDSSRHCDIGDMHTASCLVHGINSLVREITVTDITFGE